MLLNEGTELDFRKIVLGKETKPNKKLWSYIEVKIKKNYKEARTAILCCLFRSALQNQLKYSVYTHSSFGLVLWFFSGRKPSDLIIIKPTKNLVGFYGSSKRENHTQMLLPSSLLLTHPSFLCNSLEREESV